MHLSLERFRFDVLWDFAATVLNATGYLAATTLMPRGSATRAPAAVT